VRSLTRIVRRHRCIDLLDLFCAYFLHRRVLRAASALATRLTLLGTGSPDPDPNRFSASTLIEAGNQKLLIDVGRGATIRLYQLKVPLSQIDVVFFTHYHSDHTIGLPDLLLTGSRRLNAALRKVYSRQRGRAKRDLLASSAPCYSWLMLPGAVLTCVLPTLSLSPKVNIAPLKMAHPVHFQ
jgi:ribonuclease BN (tRNA processing enzyme)